MEQVLLSPKEAERYNMVQDRLIKEYKIEKILSYYSVSKRTFYVNLHKFEKGGIEGLKSRWGEHRKTKLSLEEKFARLFKKYPYFSSYEFSEIIDLNPRTIQRIIIRKNLSRVPKAKKERRAILENIKNPKKKGEAQKTRRKAHRERKTTSKGYEEKTL